MLDGHGRQSAQAEHFIRDTYVSYAITTSDTDHRSVERRLIGFFRRAADVGHNIVSDDRSGQLGVFDHLRHRHGCTFRNIEDVVPYDIYVLMCRYLELVIGQNPLASFLLDIEAARKIRALNACGPNDGTGFQLLIAQSYAVSFNLGNLRACNDVDLQLPQVLLSFLDQLFRKNRQNFVDHINDME
ncbi:hypothetical protein D3C78_1070240 [compost metagenome]